MKEVIIKTQKQLDKLKPDFEGTIYIEGGSRYDPLELRVSFEDASVIVRGEAWVRLRGSSHAELWESSHAVLRGSSHAVLRGSSHAVLRGSSVMTKLFGEAMVTARYAKEIICAGYNVISVRKSDQKQMNIVMNDESVLKVVPDFVPTWENYSKQYPVEVKDGVATLYKAVRKREGKLISDWDKSFEYKVGEVRTERCDKSTDDSCSYGLHVSPKSWALSFGCNWDDLALLEVEVPVEKIVVAKDTDGKVRTSELKVVREVPREEWYAYNA